MWARVVSKNQGRPSQGWWWLGLAPATLEFSIPKREEPGKTGAPCVKTLVPGSLRVPGQLLLTPVTREKLVDPFFSFHKRLQKSGLARARVVLLKSRNVIQISPSRGNMGALSESNFGLGISEIFEFRSIGNL